MRTKAKRNRGYGSGYPRIFPLGDSAVIVQLGSEIDPQINSRVLALEQSLLVRHPDLIRATIPAYASLTIHYDSDLIAWDEIQEMLASELDTLADLESKPGRLIEIPVVYGREWGPDMEFVARHCGLTIEEVIRRHSLPEYRVHFIGFLPGFPYLGGMHPSLQTPRLQTPRTLVKAGSVGIAGGQTGIYPLDSPGGWQIIGWTPVSLFDINRDPPALLAPGDRLRFISLDPKDLPHA